LVSCVESQTHPCAGDFVCPVDKVCVGNRCVFAQQIESCKGHAPNDSCSYADTPHGICLNGICVPEGCGNGVVEAMLGEICDDGNTVAGDGCSPDCKSLWSPMNFGSASLDGVWGSGPADVFAVGTTGGALLPFDGAGLSSLSSRTTESLFRGWGSRPADVFAVGFGGAILHFDGASWSSMSSGTTDSLFGVWGSGPSDVFAVGSGPGAFATILHFGGSGWSAMTSGSSAGLVGVWGSGPADVFAVGSGGALPPLCRAGRASPSPPHAPP